MMSASVITILLALFTLLYKSLLRSELDFSGEVYKPEIPLQRVSDKLQMFGRDCGRYPTTDERLMALVKPPLEVQRWRGPYVESDKFIDELGNPINYVATPDGFKLQSAGADGCFYSVDDSVVSYPISSAKPISSK
jgi:general secretion pathway protein G